MASMPALQSMLKWTLGQQGDGTSESGPALQQMTAERRAFLEEVFASIGQDETAAMQSALEALTSSDGEEGARENKLVQLHPQHPRRPASPVEQAALANLQEAIEDMDNAGDLATIGGLAPVAVALQSRWPDVQCAAAEVVATAAQNNPRVQEYMLQSGVRRWTGGRACARG